MAKGLHSKRYKHLISLLVAERKRLGWSQETFAARVGWVQQHISRLELGDRRIDPVEFADIARALGLDPVVLMAEIPASEPPSDDAA